MHLRLLIIDDNPADRSLMRRLFRSSGLDAEVVEVARVEDFLNQPHNTYDCILLDNRLPDGEGIDALDELSETNLPPVIVMSGQGDEQIAARAIKSGAADYLVKDSVTPRGLARAISNAIEIAELEKGVRRDNEDQVRALAIAERANEAKAVFLAKLSHELRVPLTSILGFSQILSAKSFGPGANNWDRYKDYAVDIHHSTTKLLSLLDNVLDMALLSSGSSSAEFAELNPMPVVADVIERWQSTAASKGVALTADLDHGPRKVLADERLLRSIIGSLVSNAVNFTPPEGIVKVSIVDSIKSWTVVIADNGSGMDPDELPWLLRPFEDYDINKLAKSKSLGIGLPMMQAAADMLGASVTFDTSPDLGTTVTATFPKSGKRQEPE